MVQPANHSINDNTRVVKRLRTMARFYSKPSGRYLRPTTAPRGSLDATGLTLVLEQGIMSEPGIRDAEVHVFRFPHRIHEGLQHIGRASCRERWEKGVV